MLPLVLAALLTLIGLVVSPWGASADQTQGRHKPRVIKPEQARIYWGAAIGTQYTGTEPPWDMEAVRDFEKITRRTPSIVHFYSYWGDCSGSTCSDSAFPGSKMSAIRHDGQIPMLSWGSEASNGAADDNARYSLTSITDGSLDSYIRRFAEASKRWGHPFFLRFDWEMNGNWFPWGTGSIGNTAAQEVAAWRHVHDIFHQVGATNVTWVWCPNVVAGTSPRTLAKLFPGNAYVDWTCLDGYNWGTTMSGWESGGWKSFTQLYEPSYRELLRLAPSKPVMVGEFASTATGGSKAGWIRNALAVIPSRFPQIRAINYFDEWASDMDWPLDTSKAVENAFATGISRPVYAGRVSSRISSGTITPP